MHAKSTIKKWKSIPFNKSWISKILELRIKVFHETGYGQSRWEWQYLNNPQGKAHLSLAVDIENSEILAGHYAMMAYKVKIEKDIVDMAQSVDTFTNPEFRNQGIFIDLAQITYEQAKLENVGAVFGFPNSSSYPGFVKKLGFHDPFGLKFWVRPLALGIISKKLKLPQFLGWKWSKIPLFLTPKNLIPNLIEVEKLPEDWNNLNEKFEDIVAICVSRSTQYMNWRFFNCPDRKYKYFEYRKDGNLIGFFVLALSNDTYPTGQIVDFIFSNLNDCQDMIKLMIWKLRDLGAYTAVSYLHHENIVANYYSHLGFKPRGSETKFILKNLSGNTKLESIELNPKNWYITGADTDYL